MITETRLTSHHNSNIRGYSVNHSDPVYMYSFSGRYIKLTSYNISNEQT